MKRELSESELRTAYGNEDPHALHVADLALKLFDQTAATLGLLAGDRRLLQAAALLHDIGFARRPQDHTRYAAQAILQRGLAGFTPGQRLLVAAGVCLHAEGWRRRLQEPLLAGLKDHARALRLAALLRVADGLDHSHLQDASIVSIRRNASGIVLVAKSAVYAPNADCANRKADLWRETFSTGIIVHRLPATHGGALFAGLIGPADALLEAARKILTLQYRTLRDSSLRALESADPEHLHDIRVAIRRFRACLRLFRPQLEGSSAERLNQSLRAMTLRLSPLRDADVWLAFLRRREISRALSVSSPESRAYIDRYRAERKENLQALRSILRSPDYNRLTLEMAHFVRTEPPFSGGILPAQPFVPYAARKLHRIFKLCLSHHRLTRKASPLEAHELRRLVRRGRYWAEFAGPVLGPSVRDLAKRFKRLADTLGDVHDMDVYREKVTRDQAPAAGNLEQILLVGRRKHWSAFKRAWARLSDKGFRKRLAASLRQARDQV